MSNCRHALKPIGITQHGQGTAVRSTMNGMQKLVQNTTRLPFARFEYSYRFQRQPYPRSLMPRCVSIIKTYRVLPSTCKSASTQQVFHLHSMHFTPFHAQHRSSSVKTGEFITHLVAMSRVRISNVCTSSFLAVIEARSTLNKPRTGGEIYTCGRNSSEYLLFTARVRHTKKEDSRTAVCCTSTSYWIRTAFLDNGLMPTRQRGMTLK